jgi:hypothetical protein
MNASTFARLAGTIFGIVAAFHAWRLATGAPVTIGATVIPMALSWLGLAITGALCVLGWRARP